MIILKSLIFQTIFEEIAARGLDTTAHYLLLKGPRRIYRIELAGFTLGELDFSAHEVVLVKRML
jgi:hypothetical protein